MRVAAIYDIHGNLPALVVLLEEIRQAEVTDIVVGGDVVAGPMPRTHSRHCLGSTALEYGGLANDWLLLGPAVQLQHTYYDFTKAAERIRDTNYPQAHDFAKRYVLQPSSEREMLEVFTRVELR